MRTHSVSPLFDRFFAGFEAAAAPRSWRPGLDLVEYPDRFEVSADLPGFRPEDVEVQYAEGVLHLRGERGARGLEEGARIHLRERTPLRFQRALALGEEIQVEAIEASFRDGVLLVRVPKSERVRPREIPISVN